jgi:hypothetical protein
MLALGVMIYVVIEHAGGLAMTHTCMPSRLWLKSDVQTRTSTPRLLKSHNEHPAS